MLKRNVKRCEYRALNLIIVSDKFPGVLGASEKHHIWQCFFVLHQKCTTPRKGFEKGICKEGWYDFSWRRPFCGSALEGLCWLSRDVKKPMRKGDTLESRIWESIFLREKSSKMTNLACLDLSEELFEV